MSPAAPYKRQLRMPTRASVKRLKSTATTTTASVGGTTYPAFTEGATYGPGYGLGCEAHDFGLVPYCTTRWCSAPINGECVSRWCGERWCWVDAATCSSVPAPSATSYFSPLTLTYSYETCNGTNVFDSFYQEVMAHKPPPPFAPHLTLCPAFTATPQQAYDILSAVGRNVPCQELHFQGISTDDFHFMK